MEFILGLINGNWSSSPLVLVIVIIIIECNHKNDINLLINRISHLKIGENRLDLGIGPVQNEKLKQMETQDEHGKSDVDTKHNDLNDIDKLKKYYHFEQIYNMAFGSQLRMLNIIKANGNQPMPYNVAVNFFYENQNLLPPANRFVKNEGLYFKWLTDANLLRNENNGFILTDYGMEFLTYLFTRNYNINLRLF